MNTAQNSGQNSGREYVAKAGNLLAILGGSFNPPHLGHLRLALEILQTLQPVRLDLLPVGRPAHKKESQMLPFDLRYAMLRCFERHDVRIQVNPLENERPGKSYTFETLRIYRERYPEMEPVFILGGEDFGQLKTWEGWDEIPSLAHLLIISRGQSDLTPFLQNVRDFWPDSEALPLASGIGQDPRSGGSLLGSGDSRLCLKADAGFRTPDGGEVWHLPLTRLDISATALRQSWLAGENISGLLPTPALHLLWQNAMSVRKVWESS